MKDCKVAVLSILAAGQGITLTAASTIIMAEMTWTPGIMIQAEDRAHRIGQEKCVNVHYLYAPGTLDEVIWPKLQSKLAIISTAVDNDQNQTLMDFMNPEFRVGMGQFEEGEDLVDLMDNFEKFETKGKRLRGEDHDFGDEDMECQEDAPKKFKKEDFNFEIDENTPDDIFFGI
jgi:hypothetical protein